MVGPCLFGLKAIEFDRAKHGDASVKYRSSPNACTIRSPSSIIFRPSTAPCQHLRPMALGHVPLRTYSTSSCEQGAATGIFRSFGADIERSYAATRSSPFSPCRKASPMRSATLRHSTSPSTSRRSGRRLALTVRDDGCGFIGKMRALACAACRRRVEGQPLAIESEAGGSTCVRVTLPLAGDATLR